MTEQTRAKVLRTMMTFITIFTVICAILAVAILIIGVSGAPIPWVETIALFVLTAFLCVSVFKYHTEYKYCL